jgi:hypothetical protein
MFEAVEQDHWDHTASLLAMQVNTAIGKKRGAKSPLEFNPYRKRRRRKSVKLTKEETRELLQSFAGVRRKRKEGVESSKS